MKCALNKKTTRRRETTTVSYERSLRFFILKTAVHLYRAIILMLVLVSTSGAQDQGTGRMAADSTDGESPLRSYISGIIKEVNTRSAAVDDIRSEGEITVKTRDIDNSGSIEIKAKKKDDVWFKIEGPLGIDIAEGHFGRKRFTFYDAQDEKAIEGTTNINNIGALTRIRCTFDDLMNAFTGTVRIVKSKSDSLNISEEGDQYVIWAKRGTIIRKYWVDKSSYYVSKYVYYGKSGSTLISIEFSNFTSYGDAWYAKRIEVRRPKQGEYFKVELESVSLGLSNLSFYVSIPSGTRRVNWK